MKISIQVGKTTMAISLLRRELKEKHPAYMNWDDPLVPPKLRRKQLPLGEPLIILDEIHKYIRWRGLVKGIYDTEKSSRRKIIVTGSARLDYYRKGGDSLVNRYRYFRLHPFSLREISTKSS